MPKVLISDSMSNVAQKIFEKNKISVDVKTGLSEEEIIKIIPEYVVFYKSKGRLWRVSDCEELVGVTHRR